MVRLQPTKAPKIDTAALHDRIGGLQEQINSLADLLELPLSRPELFDRYGKYSRRLPVR